MTKKMYVRTLKVVVLIVATSLLLSSLLSEEANTTPSISDQITAEQVLSLSKQQQELSSPGDMSPSLVDDETQPPREMQIQTPDTGQEEGGDFSERVTTSSEETRVDLSYFGVQTTTPSKETYHTNNPTLSRDDQSTLQNYEMDAISDTTQVTAETQDIKQLRDMKYLLAINFYQGGPNFHYDNFKIGLFYAITRNRAIVTLPFANHYGHREESFFWSFDDTFERGKLAQALPVITPEQFHTLCNGSVEVMLMNPYTERNRKSFSVYEHAYKKTRSNLKEVTNISMPPFEDMPKSAEESQRRYLNINKVKCVGMFKPLDFWRIMKMEVTHRRKRQIIDLIDKNLKRTPSLRHRVDAILYHLCQGRPFLSMHWRNRTGEVCQMQLRNAWKLDCNRLLTYISMASKKVVRGVEQIMEENNLSCVYVAHPSYSWEIVELMKAKIPNVYTSEDILALDIPEVANLNENYLLSLVEQEIVYRGVIFIASLTTNWSEFVARERAAEGKKTLFLNEVPEVPKHLHKLI